MNSENCFLMLLKDQDKYLFKYVPGDEKYLFFTLLEMGRSEDYNISLVEVFHVVHKISRHLQEHGVGKSMTFEWPLTAE